MAKQEDSSTGKKLAIGALLAGAAGYITGLLTAPRSGKETREDIADKAADLRDNTEEQLQNAHDELEKMIKETKGKTLALKAKARQEYNEALVRAKDAKDKAGSVLKAVKAGEAKDPELNRAIKQAKQAQKNLLKYLKS